MSEQIRVRAAVFFGCAGLLTSVSCGGRVTPPEGEGFGQTEQERPDPCVSGILCPQAVPADYALPETGRDQPPPPAARASRPRLPEQERPPEVEPPEIEMVAPVETEPRLTNKERRLLRMAEARVICFGELHDRPEHHRAERNALVLFLEQASGITENVAVGFEMFQRPFQQPLSAFVAGTLAERQFLEATEYETRWGWPYEYYRPLLETTGDFGADALALNASSELTRQIADRGLAELDDETSALLPELDLTDEEHACYFTNLGVRAACPKTPPPSQYEVQVVWDETMAETASQWLSDAPDDARLMIFAGMAHCQRSAIPRRIRRRTGIDVLSVMPLTPGQIAQLDAAVDVFDMVLPIKL